MPQRVLTVSGLGWGAIDAKARVCFEEESRERDGEAVFISEQAGVGAWLRGHFREMGGSGVVSVFHGEEHLGRGSSRCRGGQERTGLYYVGPRRTRVFLRAKKPGGGGFSAESLWCGS